MSPGEEEGKNEASLSLPYGRQKKAWSNFMKYITYFAVSVWCPWVASNKYNAYKKRMPWEDDVVH